MPPAPRAATASHDFASPPASTTERTAGISSGLSSRLPIFLLARILFLSAQLALKIPETDVLDPLLAAYRAIADAAFLAPDGSACRLPMKRHGP